MIGGNCFVVSLYVLFILDTLRVRLRSRHSFIMFRTSDALKALGRIMDSSQRVYIG